MPSSNKARRCCLHNPLEPVGECSCACHRAALSARPTGDTLPAAVLDNMADAVLRPTGDTALRERVLAALRSVGPHEDETKRLDAILTALSTPATPPTLDVEALAFAERMERMFVTGQAGGDVASVASILRHFAREYAAIKGDAT